MKLSIITINYNDAAGLERTVESIIPKKIEGVEFLVIDGNSTDTSLDVIVHHKENIDFWLSEPDKGIYSAMNKGIEKANGEYLLFINSGDIVNADADLSKQIEQLNGEDIIYCNLNIITENSFVKKYPSKIDFKYMLEDSLPHAASFIKKSLFHTVGLYREDLKIISDWAFFLDAIILHKCSYKYIDTTFSSFYLGGISSSWENRTKIEAEKANHLQLHFPSYYSLYQDWIEKRHELYKLKASKSVTILKKLGFLKWLKL